MIQLQEDTLGMVAGADLFFGEEGIAPPEFFLK